jgi:transketolase
MRNAFLDGLLDLAIQDDRVMFLTGDLGFTVVEPFRERFPDRFVNAGVSEQNMVGMATGLAEAGMRPFVYSIATFASLRPYEFIRNGPIVHNLPVRVVGVGGGVDYGHNGITHFALEDVAVMRVQPGMAVVAPASREQARAALMATADLPGPVYYRIGKGGAPNGTFDDTFELGRANVVGDGEDIAILSYGSLTAEAFGAAKLLEDQGLRTTVVVCASLSPAPVADLVEVLGRVPLAITAEAHYVNGGLGSLAAEVIAEHGLGCRLIRRGFETVPVGDTGHPEYILRRAGLDADGIARAALNALAHARS